MIVMAVFTSPVTTLTYGTLSSTSQMACTIPRITAALAVLFPDVVATSLVVSVWPRLPRRKSLLVTEAVLFDEDPANWAGVFEDGKVSDDWLPDDSFWPFRWKIFMVVARWWWFLVKR